MQILIECKKIGEKLNQGHLSQLYRYFGASSAKIAILTNGRIYEFYSDLEKENQMDLTPFFILDMCEIDEHIIPELKKLTKTAFDLDSVIASASDLKYLNMIKKLLIDQLKNPHEKFVEFFARETYSGILTQKVRDQFTSLAKKALNQFLNDQVRERLNIALNNTNPQNINNQSEQTDNQQDHIDNGIVTTEEELEGLNRPGNCRGCFV